MAILWSSLLAIAFALIAAWMNYRFWVSLKTQTIRGRGALISRAANPIQYWVGIAFGAVVMAVLDGSLIWFLFQLPNVLRVAK